MTKTFYRNLFQTFARNKLLINSRTHIAFHRYLIYVQLYGIKLLRITHLLTIMRILLCLRLCYHRLLKYRILIVLHAKLNFKYNFYSSHILAKCFQQLTSNHDIPLQLNQYRLSAFLRFRKIGIYTHFRFIIKSKE